MNHKNAKKTQKAVLIVLVILLCIGLMLPSLAQIVLALSGLLY